MAADREQYGFVIDQARDMVDAAKQRNDTALQQAVTHLILEGGDDDNGDEQQ